MAPRINVSFEKDEVFSAVVAKAGDEQRSLSSMAAILVERGLSGGMSDELLAAVTELGAERALDALTRELRRKGRAA